MRPQVPYVRPIDLRAAGGSRDSKHTVLVLSCKHAYSYILSAYIQLSCKDAYRKHTMLGAKLMLPDAGSI